MESFNEEDHAQTSFIVSDVYRNENENCFLREDCLIDFNNLVSDLNFDRVKREHREEMCNSRDTSETESATEEVENIDIKLFDDEVIIFHTEDDLKEAYPNLQIYNENQIEQRFTVEEPLNNNEIKNELDYNSLQFHGENSIQAFPTTDPLEDEIKNESKVFSLEGQSGNSLESTLYYIDSFPLTKNPPDEIKDESNGDEMNIEGSYTLGLSNNSQNSLGGDIVPLYKENSNSFQHYSTEENKNNIVIISMKKFFVDKSDGAAQEHSKSLITSPLPSHKWKRLYECFQCGKKFSHSINLKIHMEVHTNELHPYKCVECGVSFAKNRQLLRHLKKHTAPEKKNFNCPMCEASYKTFGHLRHHLVVIHRVENVDPNLCLRSVSNSTSAQIFIVKPKIHSKSSEIFPEQVSFNREPEENITEDLLKCPICNKIYKSRGGFKKHTNLHSEEEYPFKCQRCDNKFLFESEFKKHETIHVREEFVLREFSFKCWVCGLRFKDFSTMNMHKKTRHLRPFKCPKKFCKAKFSLRHRLISHSLSHSKARPFKCVSCGSAFKRQSSLDLHSRVHYPLGKPYRCAECFSGMISKHTLKRHRCNPKLLEYLENNENINTACEVKTDASEIKQEMDNLN